MVNNPETTRLDELVQITLQQPGATDWEPLAHLREIEQDGRFVLEGRIDEQGSQSGVYKMAFALNTAALSSTVIGLSSTEQDYRFERAITTQWRDPAFWDRVFYGLAAVLALLIAYLLWVNVRLRMYGTVRVTYTQDMASPLSVVVPLGGPRLRVSRHGKGQGHTLQNETVKVRISVRPVKKLSLEEDAAPGSPFGGTPVTSSEPRRAQRNYRVTVKPSTGDTTSQELPSGGSSFGFGDVQIEHHLFESD